jgi:hypothetical protein
MPSESGWGRRVVMTLRRHGGARARAATTRSCRARPRRPPIGRGARPRAIPFWTCRAKTATSPCPVAANTWRSAPWSLAPRSHRKPSCQALRDAMQPAIGLQRWWRRLTTNWIYSDCQRSDPACLRAVERRRAPAREGAAAFAWQQRQEAAGARRSICPPSGSGVRHRPNHALRREDRPTMDVIDMTTTFGRGSSCGEVPAGSILHKEE